MSFWKMNGKIIKPWSYIIATWWNQVLGKSHLFFQNQHGNQGTGDQSRGELEVTGGRTQTTYVHLPQNKFPPEKRSYDWLPKFKPTSFHNHKYCLPYNIKTLQLFKVATNKGSKGKIFL